MSVAGAALVAPGEHAYPAVQLVQFPMDQDRFVENVPPGHSEGAIAPTGQYDPAGPSAPQYA